MKPEKLNLELISSALVAGYWRVTVIDEIDSTQNYLRTSKPKSGDVITAEYQSAGRGRLDRSFSAIKSTALLFSIYIEPKIEVKKLGYLTLLAGESVANTLNVATNSLLFNCKWPNDILHKEYKVAGILAEKSGAGVILGIGINVSTARAQLPVTHATSILLASNILLDRNELLASILNGLNNRLTQWQAGVDLTDSYRKISATLGKSVEVQLPSGEKIRSTALDIDETGALHLANGQLVTVGDVIHLDSKLSE